VIDIGRSTVPRNETYYTNQVANESISFFGRQDNYAPPPYSSSSTEFCSQCGTSRQDLTAKFCSSCGKSFNKY
jgi:membrane protease subunit (stomatin/prohibitin family)